MKKGDVIQGRIEKVLFPNRGVMHTDDTDVIVKNALPGQVVNARVNKKRNGRCEAALLEVAERSPLECSVKCPQYGICGGCLYLSYPYEEELRIKEKQIRDLLYHADPEVDSWMEPILASPRYEAYRNKMEFSFGDAYMGGPLTLGMHKRGSFYDLTDASECELVDQDYRTILTLTITFFREKEIPFYHRVRKEGYLRHLLVRRASHTGEILIDLVTSGQNSGFDEETLLREYCDLLTGAAYTGTIAGILHTRNDSAADIVRDDGTDVLYGRGYFEEELLGLKFIVTPFSFFQTNSYGAEVLYDKARELISLAAGQTINAGRKPVVFDLYCGTGTISQLVSPAASKVIGVEIVEEAVEAAKENAKRNGIDNCEFIAGDVLKVIDEIEEKPDLIILDPPRDGIHPKALPKIIAYGVEYILYISCKATSLQRDLPFFMEAGYKPVKGVCVDQFPRTANVETAVLLSGRKS